MHKVICPAADATFDIIDALVGIRDKRDSRPCTLGAAANKFILVIVERIKKGEANRLQDRAFAGAVVTDNGVDAWAKAYLRLFIALNVFKINR